MPHTCTYHIQIVRASHCVSDVRGGVGSALSACVHRVKYFWLFCCLVCTYGTMTCDVCLSSCAVKLLLCSTESEMNGIHVLCVCMCVMVHSVHGSIKYYSRVCCVRGRAERMHVCCLFVFNCISIGHAIDHSCVCVCVCVTDHGNGNWFHRKWRLRNQIVFWKQVPVFLLTLKHDLYFT